MTTRKDETKTARELYNELPPTWEGYIQHTGFAGEGVFVFKYQKRSGNMGDGFYTEDDAQLSRDTVILQHDTKPIPSFTDLLALCRELSAEVERLKAAQQAAREEVAAMDMTEQYRFMKEQSYFDARGYTTGKATALAIIDRHLSPATDHSPKQ